ncbi:hypothetical protein SEA_ROSAASANTEWAA_22 [Streptomyces phage RosaAsantewaa]|nr:hypothetical protein SEA_ROSAASANTEWAA_22 [Streptomyces phage RosaAsantewaa]
MAEGDQAAAAGYAVVPDTGEEGRVRWGAREINRTRDYIALLKALLPVGKSGYRDKSGITSGTADPTGGSDGDIYFKIIG